MMRTRAYIRRYRYITWFNSSCWGKYDARQWYLHVPLALAGRQLLFRSGKLFRIKYDVATFAACSRWLMSLVVGTYSAELFTGHWEPLNGNIRG